MKLRTFLFIFFILLFSSFFLYQGYLLHHPRYTADITPVDLMPVLNQETLSASDYALLYEQTGLSEAIIKELSTASDFKQKVLDFQADYLKEISVFAVDLPPVTVCEMAGDPALKRKTKVFNLAPYHNGYIFLTKSTVTLGWRHGHIGLVVDEIRGITLEAISPGIPSSEQLVTKWEYYPTFKMMRPKNINQTQLNAIAHYADTCLKGLPYNILADKSQENPEDTHCALLIWQAYHHFGYDLDSTGGLFVSPGDIAGSPLLEVLQIYGFNPNKDW